MRRCKLQPSFKKVLLVGNPYATEVWKRNCNVISKGCGQRRRGGSKSALCNLAYCSSHLFTSYFKLSNCNSRVNLSILLIHFISEYSLWAGLSALQRMMCLFVPMNPSTAINSTFFIIENNCNEQNAFPQIFHFVSVTQNVWI